MGINIADNFAYNGKKPMDNRTEYTTLAAMKAVVDANINEGCMCYNKEDGKYYTFKSTNTVDATTGKWREFETGGGGQTYNDFTGATASTAGAHGLVPAPSAGDEGKVLFGNGAWGALPSVDLSVLSNEAFQLTTTEKAIGQYKDGKLLYGKIIPNISVTGSTSSTASVLPNTEGIDTLVYFEYIRHLYDGDAMESTCITSATVVSNAKYQVTVFVSNQSGTSIGDAIIFYTKTTDSPLPAGVKFAGVTSTGEVILEKTVTQTNLSTGTINIAHGISNYGELQEVFGRWTDSNDLLLRKPLAMQTDLSTSASKFALQKVDATNVVLYVGSDFSGSYNIKKVSITVRYTLAS